ncbi:unnamed protein product, partial [Meganyctiphanes norvegica]
IYTMINKPRGIASIVYSTEDDPKYGEKNQQWLKEMWEGLGFQVIEVNNPNKDELTHHLEHWKSEIGRSPSKHDCFSFSFIGHGGIKNGEEYLLLRNKEEYKCIDLYAKFSAPLCPGLAGKPKLFILQACRGVQNGKSVELFTSASPSNIVTDMSDYFILQPSFLGYKSYFNIQNGQSPFIETVKDVFLGEYRVNDVQSMATNITRKISNNSPLLKDGKSQTTTITTTLRKALYFDGIRGGILPRFKSIHLGASNNVKKSKDNRKTFKDDTTSNKVDQNKFAADEKQILCKCGLQAKQRLSKQDDENKGRVFYRCSKSIEMRCDFVHLGNKLMCKCSTPALRLVASKGENKGRVFFQCSNANKKCGFFRWEDSILEYII